MKSNSQRRVYSLVWIAVSISMLIGCSRAQSDQETEAKNGSAIQELANFSRKTAYVDVLTEPGNEQTRGSFGGIASGSGRGGVCCIGLPLKWRPGLKIQVEVRFDTAGSAKVSQVIELPRYPDGDPGTFYITILPDESIEAFATPLGNRDSSWPSVMKVGRPCVFLRNCEDLGAPAPTEDERRAADVSKFQNLRTK